MFLFLLLKLDLFLLGLGHLFGRSEQLGRKLILTELFCLIEFLLDVFNCWWSRLRLERLLELLLDGGGSCWRVEVLHFHLNDYWNLAHERLLFGCENFLIIFSD